MNFHLELPLQRLGQYPQAMEERIIQIAKSQGGMFEVSPRYRDLGIEQVCRRLKKKGVFRQIDYGLYKRYKLIPLK